jgi:hypothetical protein
MESPETLHVQFRERACAELTVTVTGAVIVLITSTGAVVAVLELRHVILSHARQVVAVTNVTSPSMIIG